MTFTFRLQLFVLDLFQNWPFISIITDTKHLEPTGNLLFCIAGDVAFKSSFLYELFPV